LSIATRSAPGRGEDLRVDDDPVDDPGFAAADGGELTPRRPGGLLEQELVAAVGADAREDVREFGEVGPPEVGEREGQHVGAPGRQAAAGDVGAVAECVDRLLHADPHGVADVPVAAHDVGHGLHRDAGVLRDVLQRDLAHALTVPLRRNVRGHRRCR
jgi:hypothetical protein